MIGLPEYTEQLDWIAGAVDRAQLPADRAAKMAGTLDRARARMADPELHIAVLGEFSSGKSTLLNAFLRQRLLPSSPLVTTRTTLTIRHRPGAPASLTDGVSVWPSGPDGSPAQALEDALERLLTTEAADTVKRLELSWPAPLLGEAVTITDTPGFSAYDAGHRDRAIAAAEEADLVLVVIPATAAMSLTLADFVAEPLRDHHDRCVFVLTKIDLVEEDEHDDVLGVTELRLRELGVKDPVVLPCHPVTALAGAADSASRAAGARAFAEVEAELAALTAEYRQSAIAATLLSLLGELLSSVETAAQERGARLVEAERELAGLSLPDLPAFLEAWSQEAVSDGTKALANVWDESSHRYFATGLESRVGDAIEDSEVTNAALMGKAASDAASSYLRREARSVVQEAWSGVDYVLTRTAAALAEDFSAQYRTLARLADPNHAMPDTPALAAGGVSMPDLDRVETALSSLGSGLSGSAVLKTGGGAAAGALVGSMFTPVIGTAIGAAIGGWLSRPTLQRQRELFLPQAMKILEETRNETAAAVADAVNEVFAGFVRRVDDVCRTYLEEWRADVESLTEQQMRSHAALSTEINTAFLLAETARRRREEIVRLRAATSRRTARTGSGEERA